jgi:hypothetical protein
MCAQTVYAKRVQELKARIAQTKNPSFQTIYNAFDELCGIKRLSRHIIIWARKQLVRFRDMWPDEDAKRLLDKIRAPCRACRCKVETAGRGARSRKSCTRRQKSKEKGI